MIEVVASTLVVPSIASVGIVPKGAKNEAWGALRMNRSFRGQIGADGTAAEKISFNASSFS